MENLKGLNELRNSKMNEMEAMVNAIKTEQRALTEEEQNKFSMLEKEIKDIDATIDAENRAKSLDIKKGQDVAKEKEESNIEDAEVRAFEESLRNGDFEHRADDGSAFTRGKNGVVIPKTIANRIIEEIIRISPIVERATRYNVRGNLTIPVYGKDDNGRDISCDFYDEFQEAVESSGKFASVELKDYICMALTKVSRQLINNMSFDIVSFVVRQVAKKMVVFIEKQLLIGTENKTEGAVSSQNVVEAAAKTAISVDDMIKLQANVPEEYQQDACYIMNPSTFVALCLLKDETGKPLVMNNYSTKFPFGLLGKPIRLSDNMPEIGAGNASVIYGDCAAMALKLSQDIELQLLREKYATQHAIGVIGSCEMDCKVQDHQGIAVLKHQE